MNDITQSSATSRPHSRLPTVLSAALALMVGLLTAGLLLAMAGFHSAWLQGPGAIVIAIVMYRYLPIRTRDEPLPPAVVGLLVVLVLVVVGSNFALRSELVIAGRDAATYANTASFLVDDGGLFPTAIADPFVGEELDFSAPGFVVRDDGTFWQQFLHSISTVYAFFGELFGKSAIFGVNAFVSGVAVLAVFAMARRLVPPWWALLAAIATAGTLPFAYYSRGTFSEMATLLLAVGGLWAAHIALSEQPAVAVGSGLLLGAATMIRVDAWTLGVAIGALLVTSVWLAEDDAADTARRIFNGFAVTAALGLIDLALFSEPYLVNVGRLLLYLVVATVGLRTVAPLFAAAPARRAMEAVGRHRQIAATVVTVGIVAATGYLWFVRPLRPPIMSAGAYGLEPLQLRDGLPIEPRSYSEQSVWWLVWYLGIPVVGAAIAGVVVAARRSQAPGTAALRFVLLAFVVPTAGYLVRPSINPDHIWAIRRFLPIVIPGLVILAVAVAAGTASRVEGRTRRRFVAAGLIAIGLIPIALTSAPLIDDADRPGLEAQWKAVCASLGDAESVLVVNDDPELPLSWQIGPPLRSWCRVSVAGIDAGSNAPPVDAMITARQDLLPDSAAQRHEVRAVAWQSRLAGPPNKLETRSLTLWVGLP